MLSFTAFSLYHVSIFDRTQAKYCDAILRLTQFLIASNDVVHRASFVVVDALRFFSQMPLPKEDHVIDSRNIRME